MIVSHFRFPKHVISPQRRSTNSRKRAFTLIEMVVVTAILSILLLASARLMRNPGPHARKTGSDLITGLVDQARAAAISSRARIILAVAEPGDLPSGDQTCHLALFRAESWPEQQGEPVQATQISRWQPLAAGVILLAGAADGIANLLDADQLTIHYGKDHGRSVETHAMVIHPRGGLHYPQGSAPVAIRIAEGGYRSGTATPNRRGPDQTIAENLLKIGRVTARAYRMDR